MGCKINIFQTFRNINLATPNPRANPIYYIVCVITFGEAADGKRFIIENTMREGKFLFTLYKNDPKTMSEVLYKATKYMKAEDALSAREEKPKKRERQDDIQQEQGRKKARTGNRRDECRPKPPRGRFTSFTPLTAPVDQVLMQIKDEEALTYPEKLKGDPNRRSKDKYCRFHWDHGHEGGSAPSRAKPPTG